MNAKLSSASVEHYTPKAYVEAARFTLGRLALDPASCQQANEVVQADQYYTEEEDGLSKPWEGPVFLNPPGGRAQRTYRDVKSNSTAVLWWAKLVDAWQYQIATRLKCHTPWSAIFVGFSLEILQAAQAPGVRWHPLDFPVCIPARRIKFEKMFPPFEDCGNRLRVPGDQPTHGNVIVCVTSELDVARRFATAFSKFGYVRGVR